MKQILMPILMMGLLAACAHQSGRPNQYSELDRINDDIKQRQRINNINDHVLGGAPLIY